MRDARTSGGVRNVMAASAHVGQLLTSGAAPHGQSRDRVVKCQRILGAVRRGRSLVPIGSGCVLRLRQSVVRCTNISCKKRFGGMRGCVGRAEPSNARIAQFRPITPCRAPTTVRTVYRDCGRALLRRGISPLLIVPTFMYSFLYVRPFGSNGNQVDHLLALLLLCHDKCRIKGCVDVRGRVRGAGSACCRILRRVSRN